MMVRRSGLSMAFDALELVARSIFDLVRLLLLIFLTALQVEGNSTNSNWSWWENQLCNDNPVILNGDKCGSACDHWNRLEEDTALMSNIGVNSSRFSLEWSKIEPSPGIRNGEAIAHYHEEIDLLISAGIEPMITLYHWAVPLWFYDMGGFEKEENNQYLIRFAVNMYKEFGHKVKQWVTLNEPSAAASLNYVIGMGPPGRRMDFKSAAKVLLNLLKCHTEMYWSIKSEAKRLGQECMVGITLNIIHQYAAKWYNGLDNFAAYVLNGCYSAPVHNFLATGKFCYYVPFVTNLRYFDKMAPASYDFLGVNFYFVTKVSMWNVLFVKDPSRIPVIKKHEVPLDMPGNTLNAEGLYTSLKTMSTPQLGARPLIITECGISDCDDTRRKLFLKRYIYATSQAIRDGCNVQGFYYWTLCDNFEWDLGYTAEFGLYSVDRKTMERKLKEGSREYISVLQRYNRGELRLKDRKDENRDSNVVYTCGGLKQRRVPQPNDNTGENNGVC